MIKYIKEPQPRLPQHYTTEALALWEHLLLLSFLGSASPASHRVGPAPGPGLMWARRVGGRVVESGWQG